MSRNAHAAIPGQLSASYSCILCVHISTHCTCIVCVCICSSHTGTTTGHIRVSCLEQVSNMS